MKPKKRVFGWIEAVFDVVYLIAAAGIGLLTLWLGGTLVAAAAFVLVVGDAFHLVPRIMAIFTEQESRYARAMGFGKLVASVTMTVFYVLLWHIAGMGLPPAAHWTTLVYALAILRIVLCLLPQNRWLDRAPPVRWGIYRNIPFVLLGVMVAARFATYGAQMPMLRYMPLAIVLSFAFYLPVVLFAGKNPKIGMLMLPKTCAYVWMLVALSPFMLLFMIIQ